MSNHVEDVLYFALERALGELPPRALGIRSYAISTEEHATQCVAALVRLREKGQFRAVIGRPGGTLATECEDIEVLPPHAAAARMTTIRNSPELQESRWLIYLNSESTPGEAGLDGLDELTPQHLALSFAVSAELTDLKELSRSRLRTVVAHIEDATIEQLSTYRSIAESHSEPYALPVLGLIPVSLANVRRPATLAQYTGTRLVSQLRSAAEVLGALQAEREEVADRLRSRRLVLDSDSDPVGQALRLCQSLERFASGRLDHDLDRLCGLSTELISVLRKGERLLEKFLGDADPDSIGVPVSGTPMGEDDLVEELGASLLGRPLLRIDDQLREVELSPELTDDTPIRLRPGPRSQFVLNAIQGPLGEHAGAGCALRTDNEGAILRGAPSRAEACYLLPDEELGRESGAVRAAVAAFRERRSALLAAIDEIVGGLEVEAEDSDLPEALGGLALLELFPLLIASHAAEVCDAYTQSYNDLVTALDTAEPICSSKLEDWMIHLDVAFSVEDGVTRAGRLLPMHPVRVARSRMWVKSGSRPPSQPASLLVTYKAQEVLQPHALENCYHRVHRVGPSERSISACAAAGLEQLWSLLAPEGLLTALDVELLDVPNVSDAILALARSAAACFDSDRRIGDWLVLRVWIAYSDTGSQRSVNDEVVASIVEQVRDDLDEALSTRAGEGLRLEILAATEPSARPRHLVLQAVQTPYRHLPDDSVGDSIAGVEIKYVPSSSGTIGRIEVRGDVGLDAYRMLLENVGVTAGRSREPGAESPSIGDTLIRGLICAGGWPIRPEPRTDVLSYGVEGEDVYVLIADENITSERVRRALREILNVPEHDVEVELQRIQSGVRALYPCRRFVQRLIEGGDHRHLRGNRGLLRAFGEVTESLRSPDIQQLVISLDDPMGLKWARATKAFGGTASRSDLLILEAGGDLANVNRIRVVELKASVSKKALQTKLDSFARQPIVTGSHILRYLAGDDEDRRERELFRRLVWLGAGHQEAAREWEQALLSLDAALRGAGSVDVAPECWLVCDEPWDEEAIFSKEVQVDAITETVTYRVISPLPGDEGTASSSTDHGPPPEDGSSEVTVAGGDAEKAQQSKSADAGETDASSASGIRVRLGRSQADDRDALWLPNRTDLVEHFNVGITGTMGTGKTQLVKSLVAQLLWGGDINVGGQRPGLLIFDYKGDYGHRSSDRFPEHIGAEVLSPFELPINPLRPHVLTRKRDFAINAREFVDTLQSVERRIGAVQREGLLRAIDSCFADAGIDLQSESSWQQPFPTIADLITHMRAYDLGRGLPQSILGDLHDLDVFAPTDSVVAHELFDRVTVIDLQELAGAPRMIKLVIAFFMNAFYSSMMRLGEAPTELRDVLGVEVQLRRLRRLVLVDEADDFMSLNLASLKNTMQQGRSFGCGVILSTQFLTHFSGTDAALRQLVGTWVLHRMSEVKAKEIEGLFGLKSAPSRDVAQQLAQLTKHRAFTVGLSADGARCGASLIRDLPFYELLQQRQSECE